MVAALPSLSPPLVNVNVSLHLHAKSSKILSSHMMLCEQYLPSVLSQVATRCLRKQVTAVLDDCFLTSQTLLSARVSNVGISGGCRFRPKCWHL